MKVRVELQSYLSEYAPDGQSPFEYEIPDGAKVRDLIARLHVPDEMAGVIVIGNRAADFADDLHDGEQVTLIPPLAGG